MLFPPDASDLLSRIPLSARTILDVGCGSATLAAAYRPLNPKARLLGIDVDPAMTALAAAHLHQVVTMDVETDPLPFDVPDGIDCIIYDEILEHLRDPWAMIHRHAEALSPDGVMLICVPNIDYWRLAERLLRGTWHDSEDQDPHHRQLRWFNLDSMRENLTRAGLTLCDVTTREPDGDQAARFAASLALGLEAMDIDPHEYARRAAPSHLIWRVRKEPRQRIILVGNMLAPVGGVSDVRVVFPMQAISTDPMVTAGVVERMDFGHGVDTNARIFVLHRPTIFGDRGHALLRGLTQAGFLVVTEFDDLPERFDMMRMGGELSFYGVHAIQTSTLAMAESLRKYNPEIAVFPNAVGSVPTVRNFTDPRAITLFFGALNREHDWLPFMPAINAIARMAGDRLRFQVVHDQSFFDALETPYKTFTPTCDYQTYLHILGGSEVSFMPLSDTPFNRAKSDLKFIEASSCRVATLASTVVYSNSVEDGRTGLLFRDPVQFHSGLLRLLAMPEAAREMADAARRHVIDNRMLAYQVGPRIAWYRSLWARRDALNLARHERMQRNRIAA